MANKKQESLCGLWLDKNGIAHRALRDSDGHTRVEEDNDFTPFIWCAHASDFEDAECQKLEGPSRLNHRITFPDPSTQQAFTKEQHREDLLAVRPLEHQYLLARAERFYSELTFDQLKRCQLDIETACSIKGSFSSATRKNDRVLAIGLRLNGENHFLTLEADTDEAEKQLLQALNDWLAQHDPDVIEGHNLFNFDLNYLRERCKRHKVPCQWGRFGQKASFRKSRLRVAERWIDYQRCDAPGRALVDTYFVTMLYDITARDLTSYSLKDVALQLGITADDGNRTYIAGDKIQDAYNEDRDRFLAYLGGDLEETEGIAGLLLPTYFAQVKNFAMSLQEATLRGTGAKVDILFLEKYYHAGASLPDPQSVQRFEGGFTRSFETGVFKHVLHYDVASLYPSLLMLIGRNPVNDHLGVFIPMLKELREYRLDYKKRAREEKDPTLQREYNARQAAFKILINSFYGYLGFEGARFADSELAAEVTAKGRELLQQLIERFQSLGCKVLEADTDGIYLSSEKWFDQPEALLEKAAEPLPDGIDLEYDGFYESMFCYKAKNYALYDGDKVTIRGSALRSRGIEPILKELSDHLIGWLLGAKDESPLALAESFRQQIADHELPVERLAKKEYLSQNPDKYAEAVETSKKPRRASLEAARRSDTPYRMGDQVTYYITPGEKKRVPDWQVAQPLENYDPENLPYDPNYYHRKIDDWLKRYADFLPDQNGQQELL